MVSTSKRSDDAAAKHQADDADDDDDDIEVPPAGLVRHRAERQPDDSEGDDHPIGPAEQRDERKNGQNQGDGADDERSGIEHGRSEEHTSELQSLMRISYAVFCLKKQKNQKHK